MSAPSANVSLSQLDGKPSNRVLRLTSNDLKRFQEIPKKGPGSLRFLRVTDTLTGEELDIAPRRRSRSVPLVIAYSPFFR